MPEQMLGLGFGFVEVGTLTPRPQPGNPKPRLFRLAEDRAVINRMGFNNRGQPTRVRAAAAVLAHARRDRRQRRRQQGQRGPHRRLCRRASGRWRPSRDYLTINISSPNTPGLRQLQDEGALRALLAAVDEARERTGPPIFLKVAPDLGEGEPDQIVRVAIATSGRRDHRLQHDGVAAAAQVAPRERGRAACRARR